MSTHIHTQTRERERPRGNREPDEGHFLLAWLRYITAKVRECTDTYTQTYRENGESRIDCKMFQLVLKTAAVHTSIWSQSPSVWHYSIVTMLTLYDYMAKIWSFWLQVTQIRFFSLNREQTRSGPLLYVVLDQVHFQFLTTAVRTVTSQFMRLLFVFFYIWHANCVLSVLISHSLNTQRTTAVTEVRYWGERRDKKVSAGHLLYGKSFVQAKLEDAYNQAVLWNPVIWLLLL